MTLRLRRVAQPSRKARYDLAYLAASRLLDRGQDRALAGLLDRLPAAALLAHPVIPPAHNVGGSSDPAAHITVRISNSREGGR